MVALPPPLLSIDALNEVTNGSTEPHPAHGHETSAEDALRRLLYRKSRIPFASDSGNRSESPELPRDGIFNAERISSRESFHYPNQSSEEAGFEGNRAHTRATDS